MASLLSAEDDPSGLSLNNNQTQQVFDSENPNDYVETIIVPDEQLSKKIREKLNDGWFSHVYHKVSFSIDKGHVRLYGVVENVHDRDRIADEIRKIRGVREVKNGIRIAFHQKTPEEVQQVRDAMENNKHDYGATDDDRAINAQIREKLNLPYFKTVDGVVTITGTVERPEDAQAIIDQLHSIDGIRGIKNYLQVRTTY